EHRIRIDHGSGVAPGDVLAEARLVPGLGVDAGVGGDAVHAPQALDDLALLRHLRGRLPRAAPRRDLGAAPARHRDDAAARRAAASGGGVALRVMFGHFTEKSAFILSHFSALGSESGRIALGGHSGSQTPQSMHSSGWITSMFSPS